MSHMGTSHVEQMGCGSFEDVSAVGTAKMLSVVSHPYNYSNVRSAA